MRAGWGNAAEALFMSGNQHSHNLKIVAPGQPAAFTFQGLRFSPANPTGPGGRGYNRMEDRFYTWTPAQEAVRSTDQDLHGATGPDSSDDARQRRQRVIP